MTDLCSTTRPTAPSQPNRVACQPPSAATYATHALAGWGLTGFREADDYGSTWLSITGPGGTTYDHRGDSISLSIACCDPSNAPRDWVAWPIGTFPGRWVARVHFADDSKLLLIAERPDDDVNGIVEAVAAWLTAPQSRSCDCYSHENYGRGHDHECNRYTLPPELAHEPPAVRS
ncbi:hypothetical protein AB0N09_05995 [Streptomyces erythrochromogenes]|uniref:hypothetical protein n=1 Tax=Streptomyces erythrochromogenes TaxID=285574 RepID=UPI00343108CB